jgi:uncharacterized MnhB-related membrane protein
MTIIGITGIIIMTLTIMVNNADVAFNVGMLGAIISTSATGAYLALDKIGDK